MQKSQKVSGTKNIKKGEYLEVLLRSPKTVFTLKDIVLLWGEPRSNTLNVRLKSYCDTGKLFKIAKGIYGKDKNYSKLELGIKLQAPAYISFETVLRGEGITFQYYSQIFVACGRSGEKQIDGQKYVFKKINSKILTSTLGIKREGVLWLATPERALLDTIYLNKRYYFDNLRNINWGKVEKILPIYNDNKRMRQTVDKLKKISCE